MKRNKEAEWSKEQNRDKGKEKYKLTIIYLNKVGAKSSYQNFLFNANCTFYRHTWYVFTRLISLVCFPNSLVSQERGTWDWPKRCYLPVRNNLRTFFGRYG